MKFTPAPETPRATDTLSPDYRRAPAGPASTPLSVLDQLLAAMSTEHDSTTLDAALDLRLALIDAGDVSATLRAFFGLRTRAGRRHPDACRRLARCFESCYVACVDFDRSGAGQIVGVRLDVPDFEALGARCVSVALGHQPPTAWCRVRYLPTATALLANAA